MRLFLDSSVLLAAAGSERGASRFLVTEAKAQGWNLVTADYCVEEVRHNLPKLRPAAAGDWRRVIAPTLEIIEVRVALDRPLVFPKAKDRPIVISALAENCDWLLTLDETDFHGKLGSKVYEMGIATPGEFLLTQRKQGLL